MAHSAAPISAHRLRRAGHILAGGGVVAHACEGVWGLACDPLDEFAVDRILGLKRRSWRKGLILIGAERAHLAPFVDDAAEPLWANTRELWAGPTTCLLPAHASVPPWLTGAHDTIALRQTAHPAAAALCRQFGGALVSTSANPQGRPAARHVWQAHRYFGDAVDMIVGGHCDTPGRASRIVDVATGTSLRT